MTVAFVTRRGRVVLERGKREGYEPPLLAVVLPDERTVELDEGVVWTFADEHRGQAWPIDQDEVLYMTETDSGTCMIRRSMLP